MVTHRVSVLGSNMHRVWKEAIPNVRQTPFPNSQKIHKHERKFQKFLNKIILYWFYSLPKIRWSKSFVQRIGVARRELKILCFGVCVCVCVCVCLFLLLLFTYIFLYSCSCNSFWYLMLLLLLLLLLLLFFCWHDRADGYFYPRILTNQGFMQAKIIYFTLWNITVTVSTSYFNTSSFCPHSISDVSYDSGNKYQLFGQITLIDYLCK